MIIVFLFPTTPQVTAQTMNYTVVVLGGWIILSLIWYYFPKYGGVNWFTGPVRNVARNPADDSKEALDLDAKEIVRVSSY